MSGAASELGLRRQNNATSHNKARTTVDTYHYVLYGKKEKAKHRCRESCDCCQPNDFPDKVPLKKTLTDAWI